MELPVGYRFKPTDEELVVHYLINKVCGRPLPAPAVQEVSADDLLCKHPKCSDITTPSSSASSPFSSRKEWYFFILEDEPILRRGETARSVGSGTGFWRLDGDEKPIYDVGGSVLASKTRLTFFSGTLSLSRKTHWKMEVLRLPNLFYSTKNFKGEKWTIGKVIDGNELRGCF